METLQALFWIFELRSVTTQRQETGIIQNGASESELKPPQNSLGISLANKKGLHDFPYSLTSIPVGSTAIHTYNRGLLSQHKKDWFCYSTKSTLKKTKKIFKYPLKTVIQERPTGIHYQKSRLGPQMSFLVHTYTIKSLEGKFHMTSSPCQDNLLKSPENLKNMNNNRNSNMTLLSTKIPVEIIPLLPFGTLSVFIWKKEKKCQVLDLARAVHRPVSTSDDH